MLAPRNTLWSTPDEVVPVLMRWIDLKDNHCVCDIGCGDGRVLLQWAQAVSSSSSSSSSIDTTTTTTKRRNIPLLRFLGIEIDPVRSKLAKERVKQAYEKGTIASYIAIEIHCANALEATHLFQDATVFFLYLIPRGLRRMQSLLRKLVVTNRQTSGEMDQQLIKVVTYMSTLPNESLVAKELCQVAHQPDSAWPVYLYHL